MIFNRREKEDSGEKLELKDIIFKAAMILIMVVCALTLLFRNQHIIDKVTEAKREREEAKARAETGVIAEADVGADAGVQAEAEIGEGAQTEVGAEAQTEVDAEASIGDDDNSEGVTLDKDGSLEFTLYDINGDAARFSKFRGKTVFMTFWSPWDLESVSELSELASAIKSDGFEENAVVIAVYSIESISGMAEKVIEIASGAGLGEENLFFDIEGKLQRSFYVESYPVTYVFDASGRVRNYRKGLFMADKILDNV